MGKSIKSLFAVACLVVGLDTSLQSAKAELTPVDLFGSTVGECQLDVRVPSEVYFRGLHSRGYVSSDSAVHRENITLELRHSGNACAYLARIETATGNAPQMASQQDVLEYRIVSDQNQSGRTGESIEFPGFFRAGDGQSTLRFGIEVPIEQHVGTGRYEDELVVSIYDFTSGTLQLVSSRSFQVTTQVPASVSASFGANADAGLTSTTLEFGRLQQNKTRSVEFAVNANTPYDISFESENGGALKHFASEAEITYALKMDGTLIPRSAIESGDAVIQGSTNSVHGLDIEILDDVRQAVAGRYEDRLTIIITAE